MRQISISSPILQNTRALEEACSQPRSEIMELRGADRCSDLPKCHTPALRPGWVCPSWQELCCSFSHCWPATPGAEAIEQASSYAFKNWVTTAHERLIFRLCLTCSHGFQIPAFIRLQTCSIKGAKGDQRVQMHIVQSGGLISNFFVFFCFNLAIWHIERVSREGKWFPSLSERESFWTLHTAAGLCYL